MSNSYGFDFLRASHNEHGQNDMAPADLVDVQATSSSTVLEVPHKSDLEKQADVLLFLRHHRSSGCLPPSVIYKSLGIDLSPDGQDFSVAQMLLNNPKVNIEEVPDPENPTLSIFLYGYRAKFQNVRDKTTLLAQINRCKYGIRWNDLLDTYEGVEKDLAELVRGGEVVGIMNSEDKDRVLFPRGEDFLVELDGVVSVNLPPLPNEESFTNGSMNDATKEAIMKAAFNRQLLLHKSSFHYIQTDIDPTSQIRRGEAIRIGGEWFRVSSAIRDDLPLDKQPPRAQAPLSVVSLKDLSKKNQVDGYVRKFDDKTIPLDGCLDYETSIANLTKAKKARERLHSIAGADTTMRNVTGGASSVLLSSFASEKNPSLLAATFAKSIAATSVRGGAGVNIMAGGRKRPTAMMTGKRPGDTGFSTLGGKEGAGVSGAVAPDAVKRAVEEAKEAASDPALSYSHAVRHGCTKDVRQMYLATVSLIPSSDVDLYKALVDNKLIEPGEKMSRARMKKKSNVDNDGKPKKRRYYERKNMRRTNTHLDGTDIGAMLARAAEKQNQGKTVGDGGM